MKKSLLVKYLLGIILLFSSFVNQSQDLGSIGNQKAVTVSGGININQIYYAASGLENRRDPYTYFLTGHLNLDIYGLSLPFSYSISNQNNSFQQPFNQYSLHPTYKWVTGHIGYTSMTFSPYTLNGHLFLGVGFDLAPTEKLKINFMYGRLQKAVEFDTIATNVLPAYRRMGYGMRIVYGSNTDNIGFSFFKAKDDQNTLIVPLDSLGILPEENLVLSLTGSKSFYEKFILTGEFASTAITRDIRTETVDGEHPLTAIDGLYQSRTSSAYYNAFNTSFTYQSGKYSLGVGYERIDPGYRTLGAYYFNNDLENITVNATTQLFNSKINLTANVGTQRDNLDGDKISSMSRVSSAFNVSYVPTERLNISLSYSNFKSFTNIRSQFVQINELTPFDNLDTLNYRQISQNTNANVSYQFNTQKDIRSMLNVNFTMQQADDEQGGVEQPTGSRFYNLNTSYTLNFKAKRMALVVAFNANRNDVQMLQTETFGPTAGITKSFLQQKLRTSISISYNNSYTNGDLVSQIINARASAMYTVKKKHNFNLSLVGLKRANNAESTATEFAEFTGTLGYNYNFSR